jgi:hypothetical protein
MGSLHLVIQQDGVLLTPTSVELESEGNDYGLRRSDNYDSVTIGGTSMSTEGRGEYFHDWTNPAVDLSYDYRIKIVNDGVTYYVGGGAIDGNITEVTVVLPTTTKFTSQAEVLRIIGSFAGDLLTEDAGPVDTLWAEVIEDADETIAMYIQHYYDPATHKTNGWLRRRATVLAANIISQRRGNNPLYVSRADRVYEQLSMIESGNTHIPDSIPRARFAPVVRNYTIQNRMQRHPQRVDTTKSTGTDYPNQDTAIEPFVFSRQL